MSFKSTINQYRRTILTGLTRNIGKSGKIKNGIIRPQQEVRILISRPNSRLGNQLLVTPLVQELTEAFPNAKIDLFVRGFLSPIIFENYPQVDRIIRLPKKPFKELGKYLKVWLSLRKYRYDLVLNVTDHSSSGRLSTAFARGKCKIYNDVAAELQTQHADYLHIAKFPVYNFRKYAALFGIPEASKPIPSLNIKLSEQELENGKTVLNRLVDDRKNTIAIYTFATGSKCYSKAWWQEVYGKLKEKYQNDYNILEILPIENVSQIDFQATSWYSKEIREIASVMANTCIFIGADSGMMHLASAAQTPTVGLFSTTSIERYGPYNRHSIAIDTNTTSVDEMIAQIDTVLHNA
ncbi:MAG: glycosyltransferase family 9 protein [Culturomica sp.]|jgi:ADP-heptose:LPS heptosyltransferase|nr:glycosyltransferase family 9 protein [Culturomica sp.]